MSFCPDSRAARAPGAPSLESAAARRRFLARERRPALLSDWMRAAFIHYRVPAGVLEADVPFELDLWGGWAWVSLVAFEFRRLRIALRGRALPWVGAPFSGHGFLNVRTYVKHRGEAGIYFLAEWLSNRRSVFLGPRLYGLPYRFGRPEYHHARTDGPCTGRVTSPVDRGELRWRFCRPRAATLKPCASGTLDEFLLERYVAFTLRRRVVRLFRVWHEPWPQSRIRLELERDDLLDASGGWVREAEFEAAHYSPGVCDVWLGKPRSVRIAT